MNAIRPEWIPPNCHVLSAEGGRVHIRANKGNSKLRFGAVPEGASVWIDAVRSQLCISAESAGKGAVLSVEQPRSVEILSRWRIVHLLPNPGLRVDVTITNRATTLVLGNGHYEVSSKDADNYVRLRLETNSDDPIPSARLHTNVSGSTLIKSLSGAGNVSIGCPFVQGFRVSDFEGTLNLGGDLNEGVVHLEQGTLVIGGTVSGCKLHANIITCKADVLADTSIRADKLEVHGECDSSVLNCSDSVLLRKGAQSAQIRISEARNSTTCIISGSPSLDAYFKEPELFDVNESGSLTMKSLANVRLENIQNCRIVCSDRSNVIAMDIVDCVVEGALDVCAVGKVAYDGTPETCVQAKRIRVDAGVSLSKHSKFDVSDNAEFGGKLSGGTIECSGAVTANGGVESCNILADRIQTAGWVVDSSLIAHGSIKCAGELDSRSAVKLEGNGEFEQAVSGCIEWFPSYGDEIKIGDNVRELKVVADIEGDAVAEAEWPIVQWRNPDSKIEQIDISGDVILQIADRPEARLVRGKQQADEMLELATNGRRIESLNAQQMEAASSRLIIAASSTIVVEEVTGAEHLVMAFASDSDRASLHLSAPSNGMATVAACGDVTFRGGTSVVLDSLPELEISGPGAFHLSGAFRRLDCSDDLPDWLLRHTSPPVVRVPELNVGEDAVIYSLTGKFFVGQISGNLSGGGQLSNHCKRKWRFRRETRRAPRMLGIDKQEAQNQGRIHDIDPTGILYHEMEHLRDLYVFEPDAHSLLEFGARNVADVFRRKARAQNAQALADLVRRRAISGNVTSAAFWMAARSLHSTIPSWSLEWILRKLHQFVGYGQRPLPALVCWISVSMFWAVCEFLHKLLSQESSWNYGLGLLSELGRMVALPADIFDLPSFGHQCIFGSAGWYLVAFVSIGIPSAFFVVALRNFLRSPLGRL